MRRATKSPHLVLVLLLLLLANHLDIGYSYEYTTNTQLRTEHNNSTSISTSSRIINFYDHNTSTTKLRLPSHPQQQTGRDLATVTIWKRIGDEKWGASTNDMFGWATAISADGSRIVVSAPQNDAAGGDAGRAYVYEYRTNNKQWNQIGVLNGPMAGAGAGQDVTISGDGQTVAIGGHRKDPWNGFIQIYRFTNNNNWRQLIKIDGQNDKDKFGGSVSLDYAGTRLAVGAAYHVGKDMASSRGKTYIYDQQSNNENEWKLVGEIPGPNVGDRSGHSVSLSSDGLRVAIGEIMASPSGRTSAGTVAIYEQTTSLGGWKPLGNRIPGLRAGEQSGTSVSISQDGGIVAIGSPLYGNNYEGMVRVWRYDVPTTTWVQVGGNILPKTPGLNFGKFGNSVSLSDDGKVLAIGEPYEGGVGKAGIYFFNAQTQTWDEDTTLTGSSTDRYGWSVALAPSGTRLVVGAYNADRGGQSNSGKARIYEFQTSDWVLTVKNLEANFATNVNNELKLTFIGTAPPGATAARTYKMDMLLASCKLGSATSQAIKPVKPTGTVPATESYTLVTELDVNLQTVRSSGFYSAVSSSVGRGNLAFCVKTEIREGNEVKATRLTDITLDIDMGQDFVVTDFLIGPNKGKSEMTEITERTIIDYHFVWYFCDELGNEITSQNGGSSAGPGDEVSVCLEADKNEPVVVENVKSVSFENELAPLLGVPLIDEMGKEKDSTTKKDCNAGRCRISAITVPRLYEYKDGSGIVRDVHKGVSMRGIVTFNFPNRRNLQETPGRMQKLFSIELDLAKPPDRYAYREPSSSVGTSFSRWQLMSISMAAVTLTAYLLR